MDRTERGKHERIKNAVSVSIKSTSSSWCSYFSSVSSSDDFTTSSSSSFHFIEMMASTSQNSRSSSNYCLCCKIWWKALKWLPVVFIVTVVVWSYYAYVVQLCLLTVTNVAEKTLYLILYHILFILFLWSYWQTIFTNLVPIPDKYKIPEAEIEKLLACENEEAQRHILEDFAKDLPVVTRTMSGAVRYCNRCVHIKPDRAHHCSMCGVCVLKMDHHCPWVNNCVCFHNYKFFVLFLGYALLYCAFISATTLQYFIQFWKNDITNSLGKFHIVFVFFVALMFAISLGSLFGYHSYLVIHNRSTLEGFRAAMFRSGRADKNGFSLGPYRNFAEVFGDDPKKWLLPVFTSRGDGSVYPVRHEHQLQPFAPPADPRTYNSMGETLNKPSSGDGVTFPQHERDEDRESLLSSGRWSSHNVNRDSDASSCDDF